MCRSPSLLPPFRSLSSASAVVLCINAQERTNKKKTTHTPYYLTIGSLAIPCCHPSLFFFFLPRVRAPQDLFSSALPCNNTWSYDCSDGHRQDQTVDQK
ncbi:MAG: hypothetical protein BYD32DRAFT_291958 [Podila humilis]|nr:MAG: hypothetical protein BYD32DRAFT_291958 [Podila humilis]